MDVTTPSLCEITTGHRRGSSIHVDRSWYVDSQSRYTAHRRFNEYPIGNLGELFDSEAWGFHDEVASQYGGVVKINAVLGVSRISLYDHAVYAKLWALQRKWLYAFDPAALQSIVLREQGTYDQIEWLIR